MIKRVLALILFIAMTSIGPIVARATEGYERANAHRLFLLAVSDRLNKFLHINRGHISATKRCIRWRMTSYEMDQFMCDTFEDSQGAKDAGLDCESMRKREKACAAYVDTALENIEAAHPRMRMYYVLKNLTSYKNLMRFQTLYRKTLEKIKENGRYAPVYLKASDLKIKDPLGLWFETDFLLEMTAPTAKEFQQAVYGNGPINNRLNWIRENACLALPELDPKETRDITGLSQMIGQGRAMGFQDLCKSMKLEFDEAKNSFFFADPEVAPTEVDQYLYTERFLTTFGWYRSLAEDHKDMELRLFQIIQQAPYIAFTKTHQPELNELYPVFSQMEKSAKELIEKNEGYHQKILAAIDDESGSRNRNARYDRPGRCYTRGCYSDENQQKLREIRSRRSLRTSNQSVNYSLSGLSEREVLKLMSYGPVVQNVIDEPPKELERFGAIDWENEVASELYDEYSSREIRHTFLVLTGVVAANVLCMAPMVRAGSFLLRLAQAGAFRVGASPLCMTVANSTINVGFLGLSSFDYTNIYNQIFAGLNHRQFVDMRDIGMAEKFLLFDWIFLPTGTAATQGLITRLVNRTSKASGERFIRRVDDMHDNGFGLKVLGDDL